MTSGEDALWDRLVENLPHMKPFQKLGIEAKIYNEGEAPELGQLPPKYKGRFAAHKGIYVVYSEGNPVAWKGLSKRSDWSVPYDVRYSTKSIDHQRLIRHAIKP